MPSEQETTLTALQHALQMEIDGKTFYLKASQASKNKLGVKLLKQLAREEDIHRAVFQKIFDVIKNKQGWPDIKYNPDGGSALRTILAKAIEDLKKNTKVIPEELDAVITAMEMENKTLDYYNARRKVATYSAEKQLYENLAMQESEHHRVLQDYYEFLQDPAQYYIKAEHSSVDGG
jgi:rubrerythrin